MKVDVAYAVVQLMSHTLSGLIWILPNISNIDILLMNYNFIMSVHLFVFYLYVYSLQVIVYYGVSFLYFFFIWLHNINITSFNMFYILILQFCYIDDN